MSYIPQDVAHDLAQYAPESAIGRVHRFDAVGLFADISGFTPMSEALARAERSVGVAQAPRSGAEELTQILNAYFSPMIDLVHAYGGIVVKFGGDAITALFPCRPQTRASAARRAIQCAVDMQAVMRRYQSIVTSAGMFRLAMKAGLAIGPVLRTTVGDPATRLEYIFAGAVLDRCADAEHQATSGEIVVHRDVLVLAGDVEVVEAHGAFYCVAGVHRPVRKIPARHRPAFPADLPEQLAACYLHPTIARRLAAGQAGLVNEHRPVTILFVRFDGFDYDADPAVAPKLQSYFVSVVRSIQHYDGHLARIDMGDKGSKYLVLFGAPTAHEDDEERALRCAVELRGLPGVVVRIGVNSGFVYCGSVGSASRKEYTVMGDAVNLAARLMQAAQPGQILVGDRTRLCAGSVFDWEPSSEIVVKGKSGPIAVAALRGAADPAPPLFEATYGPLVGRERELARAGELIARAASRQGQILGICADAGTGKSRLAAEIVSLARERHFGCFAGLCQSYGITSSYLVWRDIWRGIFALDSTWPLEAQVRHVEHYLAAIDRRLVQQAPLLSTVLNIPIQESELTAALDAQSRADLLKSLLLTCLRNLAANATLLLVLEDCHWIDPLSRELLEFLGRNIVDLPIMIVVPYREIEGEHGALAWAERAEHATILRLADLSREEAEQLVRLKVRQRFGIAAEPPADFVELVLRRTQGNPFYIEELVNYTHDRSIDLHDRHAMQLIDLPNSLRSLVMSRIDRLAEGEQTTIKVASVIGRSFKANWVWGSYPSLGKPEMVLAHLETLRRLELTPLERQEPDLEYVFKHSITQEAAYESLTIAMRATLHNQVGALIEEQYAASIAQYLDVLAYHFGRSGNQLKQRLYFRRAGDAARDAYANAAAIDYYARLLPLLPQAEQSDVIHALGEVHYLIGGWTEAERLFREALALAIASGERRAQARCQRSLGVLLSQTQTYAEALGWLDQARAGFARLRDTRGVSSSLEQMSFAYFQQGDYDRALASARRQLQIARRAGDQIGMGEAIHNIGLAYFQQGAFDQAREQLEHVIEIATASGDKRRLVHAQGDLAMVYWQQSDPLNAWRCLERALEAASEIGYLQKVGAMIGNAGVLYEQLGDDMQALACYEQSLHIAAELNDVTAIAALIANIALIYRNVGVLNRAEHLIGRAIALDRELQLPLYLCENLHIQAELLARGRRYEEAWKANQEALVLAEQVGRRDVLLQAQIHAVDMRVHFNQLTPSAAVDELTALLPGSSDDSGRAEIYTAIWRYDASREDARRAAAECFRRLYDRTQSNTHRRRYIELSGRNLPEPPPLPSLPTHLFSRMVNLDALLALLGVDMVGLEQAR